MPRNPIAPNSPDRSNQREAPPRQIEVRIPDQFDSVRDRKKSKKLPTTLLPKKGFGYLKGLHTLKTEGPAHGMTLEKLIERAKALREEGFDMGLSNGTKGVFLYTTTTDGTPAVIVQVKRLNPENGNYENVETFVITASNTNPTSNIST